MMAHMALKNMAFLQNNLFILVSYIGVMDKEPKNGFKRLYLSDQFAAPPEKAVSMAASMAACLRRQSATIDRFAILESPSGQLIPLIHVRGKLGEAAINCHTYVDYFLEGVRNFLSMDLAVMGIPICGVNPQHVILDETTRLVATIAPDPRVMAKAVEALFPLPGDIIIWRSRPDIIIHSAILSYRDGDGRWIVDDKWNERPAHERPLEGVIQEMHPYYFSWAISDPEADPPSPGFAELWRATR